MNSFRRLWNILMEIKTEKEDDKRFIDEYFKTPHESMLKPIVRGQD